jgi:hypothetical protein
VTGLAYHDGLVTRRALLTTGAAGLLLPLAGCSGSPSGTHPARSSGTHPASPSGPDPVAAHSTLAARLAVMSTRTTPDAQPSNALLAQATSTVLPTL